MGRVEDRVDQGDSSCSRKPAAVIKATVKASGDSIRRWTTRHNPSRARCSSRNVTPFGTQASGQIAGPSGDARIFEIMLLPAIWSLFQ
jgi:hypothetical protein